MHNCFWCNKAIERAIFDVEGKPVHLDCLKKYEAQKGTAADRK